MTLPGANSRSPARARSDGRVRRRPLARAAGAALALLLLVPGCDRGERPPNILLYVVDTLRADTLRCHGNANVRTPNLDELARQGTRFARAYANAPWTRPSLASLLTGEYPSTHGVVGRHDALSPALPTLPALLRSRGYRTAAIAANPNVGSAFGFDRGFERYLELYNRAGERRVVFPEELIAAADRVVDTALEWLAEEPRRPWFLLVFSIDPHVPYTPPPPYDRLYDPDYQGAVDGSMASLFGLDALGTTPPRREIDHLRALYDGEVAFNDRQFGRLLQRIDLVHGAENTVVVVTADHGEEFYEHGRREHGHSLYEELIHVPLLVRWPGRVPAQTYEDPVQLNDLFPTLLGLAGAPAVDTPGRDLAPILLRRERVDPRAYAELNLEGRRLRTLIVEHHKLIVDDARGTETYFDLSADPGEQHARSEVPVPDLAPRLRALTQEATRRGVVAPAQIAPAQLPDAARQALEALGYGDPARTPAR